MFDSSDLIHSYTRAQAIEDGVLVDVSDVAKEAGFKLPVAITRAAWARYVEVPAGLEMRGQSVEGRLWDVLFMLHVTIKRERATDRRFTTSSTWLSQMPATGSPTKRFRMIARA